MLSATLTAVALLLPFVDDFLWQFSIDYSVDGGFMVKTRARAWTIAQGFHHLNAAFQSGPGEDLGRLKGAVIKLPEAM